MITKKLKDFLKISLRYKSQNYFKFSNPKKIIQNNSPFITKILPNMADQGKRTKEKTGESIPESKNFHKIGGAFKLSPNPQYIEERIKLYDNIIQNQRKLFENAEKHPIKITLKDGKVIDGKCFETTAYEIGKKISKKLAESCIVAKVTYSKKASNPLDSSKN